MEEKLSLTTEQLDILKEIGSIGAGNAATALGQLLNRKISIDITQVNLLPLDRFSEIDFLEKSEELNISVSLRILGELEGGMLILFPWRSALLMIDILLQKEIGSTGVFSREDESALGEGSHIICCSYLNAVGQFLNVYQLMPSVNEISVGRRDELNKILIKKVISTDVNYVLPIENHLTVRDTKLNLLVVFLLKFKSLNRILKMIGL